MMETKNSDAELIALDAIEEIARSMIGSALSLHANACAADIICVDADLSQLRLEIIAAMTTLREVRPRPDEGGAR